MEYKDYDDIVDIRERVKASREGLATAKEGLKTAKMAFRMARAKKHTELLSEKEYGRKLTQTDIEALKLAAQNEPGPLQDAYLEYVKAIGAVKLWQVAYDNDNQEYWDSKDRRP